MFATLILSGVIALCTSVFSGIVLYYIKQRRDEQTKLQELLNKLCVDNAVHEEKIDQHEDRIEKLENKLA